MVFAVLLAFVIFGTFESNHAAREAAGTESVAVRQLFSTAQFFPSSDRESLQGELICYGRAVVNDEWPKMAKSEEKYCGHALGGAAGQHVANHPCPG